MNIHPTALVDASVRIAAGTVIGAYTVIGPGVEISENCCIDHHVNIEKDTSLGPDCRVWPFASIGSDPQDLKYKGEPTRLVIGARTRIREFVTISRGTGEGGGVTSIGDDCLIMAYSHVAHDCRIGNQVVMANATTLAGHIIIEDNVGMGGMVAVHQFCRIGTHAFIGGCSSLSQDAAPYMLYEGIRAGSPSVNIVGLKRSGFSPEVVDALKQAHKILFRSQHTVKRAVELINDSVPMLAEIRRLLEFIKSAERGISR
ncbi:MAG: acyl-ACP--UDP-N-acetylglucosamine O-acyltransferase [Desulfarculales bacterium]|jgi:UDP-N-acetylglucosamine acyltransferase|nr:acyl-ACP--UDP-N-acetylglucosamine O-acyltransferase [Desulfarculales bacterium]